MLLVFVALPESPLACLGRYSVLQKSLPLLASGGSEAGAEEERN